MSPRQQSPQTIPQSRDSASLWETAASRSAAEVIFCFLLPLMAPPGHQAAEEEEASRGSRRDEAGPMRTARALGGESLALEPSLQEAAAPSLHWSLEMFPSEVSGSRKRSSEQTGRICCTHHSCPIPSPSVGLLPAPHFTLCSPTQLHPCSPWHSRPAASSDASAWAREDPAVLAGTAFRAGAGSAGMCHCP